MISQCACQVTHRRDRQLTGTKFPVVETPHMVKTRDGLPELGDSNHNVRPEIRELVWARFSWTVESGSSCRVWLNNSCRL
jgi:hypothetical protein